jgi:hypothetical protein
MIVKLMSPWTPNSQFTQTPSLPLTHKILFKGNLYHWCGDHHTLSLQLQEHHAHIPKVINQEALHPLVHFAPSIRSPTNKEARNGSTLVYCKFKQNHERW